MNEVLDRPIIDREAAPVGFGDKPTPSPGQAQDKPKTSPRRVKSLAFAGSGNQASGSAEMTLGLCAPICPAATLPVSRKRSTSDNRHVLTDMPNCSADQ